MGFLKNQLGKLHIGTDHERYVPTSNTVTAITIAPLVFLRIAPGHRKRNLQCMKPHGTCMPLFKAYLLINTDRWACATASRKLLRRTSPGVPSPACLMVREKTRCGTWSTPAVDVMSS